MFYDSKSGKSKSLLLRNYVDNDLKNHDSAIVPCSFNSSYWSDHLVSQFKESCNFAKNKWKWASAISVLSKWIAKLKRIQNFRMLIFFFAFPSFEIMHQVYSRDMNWRDPFFKVSSESCYNLDLFVPRTDDRPKNAPKRVLLKCYDYDQTLYFGQGG